MRNKSGHRRFSRVVWRDLAKELPDGLWNTEFSRIYGISGTSGEELIFKRVAEIYGEKTSFREMCA